MQFPLSRTLITPDLSHHIKSLIGTRGKEEEELSFGIGRRGEALCLSIHRMLHSPSDTDIASCVKGGIEGESVDLLARLFGRLTRSAAQATKATTRRPLQSISRVPVKIPSYFWRRSNVFTVTKAMRGICTVGVVFGRTQQQSRKTTVMQRRGEATTSASAPICMRTGGLFGNGPLVHRTA